ncbi:MAG: GIY-YIG nuclease family protein [bacterium]|nr:GIY-YIG nuclease family protein [bacterium]
MPSATIKLFLVHGDPKRLRTAEISNWSGKAIAAPRTEIEELVGRPEIGQSGVYLLTGSDLTTGSPLAYIGEGEVLKDRLKSHSSREFWVQAFAFVSKDENLTKSHIRYLEGRLIEDAKQSGRFGLENQQASGARLPESDREDMEVFLDKIHQLLPVLGAEILTRVPTYEAASAKAHLLCEIKGVTAKGQRTPGGFVVFKGSQAVLKTRPSAKKWPYVLTAT